MRVHIQLLLGAVMAASAGLTACQPSNDRSVALRRDMNGMVIGNSKQPGQRLTVGVGDTVSALVERNPFLGQLKLSADRELRLPLQSTFDMHYDDGDLKLDVGCVIRANIDGNKRFLGAAFIGMKLCEEPLDDWNSAIDKAVEVMRRLEQQNPQIRDMRSFYLTASELELQAIGGPLWRKSDQDLFTLLTPEQARAKFAQEAGNGHEEILRGRWKNTLANVGIYVGSKAIFEIGVSKTAHFGGDNLTEAQRRTMRYEITMSFRLRYDVDPATLRGREGQVL
jgi:hypothetical protein